MTLIDNTEVLDIVVSLSWLQTGWCGAVRRFRLLFGYWLGLRYEDYEVTCVIDAEPCYKPILDK